MKSETIVVLGAVGLVGIGLTKSGFFSGLGSGVKGVGEVVGGTGEFIGSIGSGIGGFLKDYSSMIRGEYTRQQNIDWQMNKDEMSRKLKESLTPTLKQQSDARQKIESKGLILLDKPRTDGKRPTYLKANYDGTAKPLDIKIDYDYIKSNVGENLGVVPTSFKSPTLRSSPTITQKVSLSLLGAAQTRISSIKTKFSKFLRR